jgi:hypothetical protein
MARTGNLPGAARPVPGIDGTGESGLPQPGEAVAPDGTSGRWLGPAHPGAATRATVPPCPSPMFPPVIRAHGRLPGLLGWCGCACDYAVPRRWLTRSRSRACRWMGVGVVTRRKPGRAGSAGWIWLRQMVARSDSRLSKLGTPLAGAQLADSRPTGLEAPLSHWATAACYGLRPTCCGLAMRIPRISGHQMDLVRNMCAAACNKTRTGVAGTGWAAFPGKGPSALRVAERAIVALRS